MCGTVMILSPLWIPVAVLELAGIVSVEAGRRAARDGASTTPKIIRRVRARFKGSDAEFAVIASAIEHVFGLCKTQVRYLEPDERPGIVADYAVAAAQDCLAVNDVSLDEVDLVICGGIARQYFEPATAMEVAAKLGLKKTHAFDVTAACVGHLEAIQTAAGYLTLHPNYRTALVCTAELSGPFLSYDIQNRARPADEDRGADDRQRGGLHAGAPDSISRKAESG